MATVAFKTIGCKLNQYETEALRAALEDAGFAVVPFDAAADYYVVNTCTVTARSDYKSRQSVRRACRARPDVRVVVTGCYAELRPADVAGLGPNVVVVPNSAKADIPKILGAPAAVAGRRVTRFAAKTRFFLKVQEGCDHVCAYCAVRRARGPSRSRPVREVAVDLETAAAQGVKEIVLVGVDLAAYGRDLAPATTLASLCAVLADLPGDFRLRLSSVDVADVEPALINVLADGRFCPHIHLPLQSGDDGVLAAMRRRYRAADFRRVCSDLLTRIPDVALGVDVIAGFPGEDARAFATTCSLVEEFPLAYLHVFPFSARPGTDAARAPAQVGPAERERRAAAAREIGATKRRSYESHFDGAVRETLVEERGRGAGAEGLTDNYLHVALDGYDGPGNRFTRVRLRASAGGVRGAVVEV